MQHTPWNNPDDYTMVMAASSLTVQGRAGQGRAGQGRAGQAYLRVRKAAHISMAPQKETSPSPWLKCMSPIDRFAPSTNTGKYTCKQNAHIHCLPHNALMLSYTWTDGPDKPKPDKRLCKRTVSFESTAQQGHPVVTDHCKAVHAALHDVTSKWR